MKSIMRPRIFTFTALLPAMCLLLGSCDEKQSSYTFGGAIEGLPDGTVLTLTPVSHTGEPQFAETTVTDGRFEFSGDYVYAEPRAMNLGVKDGYGSRYVIIEPGDIEMKAVAEGQVLGDGKTSYTFSDVRFSGSESNLIYQKLLASCDTLDALYERNQRLYGKVLEEAWAAQQVKDKACFDSIRATALYQEGLQAEKNFFETIDRTYATVVRENRNTFWGPLMMITYYNTLIPELRPLYDSLSDEAKNTYYGKMAGEELYPVGRPGDTMPDFAASNAEGSTTFRKLCAGKKCVILDFWASWCAPCRKEIPNLKAIYERHHAGGFDVVSISIDNEEAAWQKALDEEQLPWNNYLDANDSIQALYKVTAVPTMYVVDGEGRMVADNLRGEELSAAIDSLMSK